MQNKFKQSSESKKKNDFGAIAVTEEDEYEGTFKQNNNNNDISDEDDEFKEKSLDFGVQGAAGHNRVNLTVSDTNRINTDQTLGTDKSMQLFQSNGDIAKSKGYQEFDKNEHSDSKSESGNI